MPAVFPASHDVFVPSHEASGKLVVDFSRSIEDFAVNRYCQIVPAEKVVGYYLRMTVEEAGRIQNTNLADFVWADGQDAPTGLDGTESFEFFPYRCVRYHYGFRLGDLTIDQASWDILAQHARIKAQQAMTARTQAAITEFTTQANYDSSHVLNVTTITGNSGNWGASTTARQDIKRSLNTAAEIILDDTLAAVDINDLLVVINSSLASSLSVTQEIVDYIKGSPESLAQIRGELPGRNTFYGLPDKLYGFPLVVEKTRKVTTHKGATTSRTQVLPAATPFMCARPGGLVGIANAPNFSTVTLFVQEEMTVQTKRDDDNRHTKGRVVDTFDAEMTAPVSGVLFTNAV
jgi:hypothetical protein